jgi:hypothetical protein
MYFCATIALLLSLLISLWYGSSTASLAATSRPLAATSSLLPSYPQGDLNRSLVPGNQPGNVAFTPDGSAYSLVRDGLLRIAPDGTKSFVGGASIYGGGSISNRIVYSNGFLWFQVHQGLERMHPDGTDRRYLQLPGALRQRDLDNFTAGDDGIYYTYYKMTIAPNGVDGLEGPVLVSISNSFVINIYPLVSPTVILRDGYYYGPSVGSIVNGPDGNVYFEYQALPGKAVYFGRVTPSGNVTHFADANRCGTAQSFVYSHDAFYFFSYTESNGPAPGTNKLCRVILSTGQYTTVLTRTAPTPANTDVGVVADNDGNLWTAGFFGTGLYSYTIATGVISGPVDPNVLNIFSSYRHSNLYIGPDQNIYFFGLYASNQLYFGDYVRHQMSFTPSVVGLVYSDAAEDFYVSEPIKSGPWTAVSLDPTIATVTPATSTVGRFSVTEVGHGSTSIKVTDGYGNVRYLSVTAN